MRAKPSRKPYAFALVLMGVLVAVAWIGRGRFSPVSVGAPAPDFVAKAMDGTDVHLSDYRGKVVLVNVWATWCPPCREEMPSMERFYESMKDKGDFEILAVSVDAPVGQTDVLGNRGGDLKAFAKKYGLTFPILHDPSGHIEDLYQTTGVPESFVVGRDGVVYRHLAGATAWDAPQYRELILRLLGEENDAAPS